MSSRFLKVLTNSGRATPSKGSSVRVFSAAKSLCPEKDLLKLESLLVECLVKVQVWSSLKKKGPEFFQRVYLFFTEE